MSLTKLVVVGIGHWKDYTLPFLRGLRKYNPEQIITLVDNASLVPYPSLEGVEIVRLEKRIGYGEALNAGAGGAWDWLICCNNDCLCHGNVTDIIPSLSERAIYGAGENPYYIGMVESGYLYIPRRVWDVVGMFDPQLAAAWEDFDYMLRVLDAGYEVKSVDVPMVHLYKHTRFEEKNYKANWREAKQLFLQKHPGRLVKRHEHRRIIADPA